MACSSCAAPFDRLDAFDRFGQHGVHVAELAADVFRGGLQLIQVALQRDEVRDDIHQRHSDQRRVQRRHDEQRHDQEHGRSDHEVEAGVQHQVDFAHVVGGARHHVADGLLIVERHALADQAGVQFVARVAFQPLPDDLAAEIAAQLQHAAHDLRDGNADRRRADQRVVDRRLRHGIERLADIDEHQRRAGGVADRADEQDHDPEFVAQDVRQHPAFRGIAAAGGPFELNGEFGVHIERRKKRKAGFTLAFALWVRPMG